MATVIWNTTNIPLKWQAQGYKETPGKREIRTEVEDGPDKVRLLGTGKTRTIEGRVLLSNAQIDNLLNYYNSNAAKKLSIPNPRSTGNITVRFKEPPVWVPVGPDTYAASLMFEVVP